MIWFHEFHFLSVAHLIGAVLKCIFFSESVNQNSFVLAVS